MGERVTILRVLSCKLVMVATRYSVLQTLMVALMSLLDAWLLKIDAAGNIQWNRRYGGAGIDYGRCVVRTSDGGYALLGVTNSSGAGFTDPWLFKVDSSGSMQWSQTYGTANADVALSLVQTSDGGYAIAGGTATSGTLYDFYLVKTGPESCSLTMKVVGQGTVAPGNGTYTLGQKVSITAIADAGWTFRGWNGAATGLSNTTIAMTGDKAVTATFTKNTPSMLPQAYWNRTYGGADWDVAYSVVLTSDGGYALAGYTNSFGAGL